MALKYSITICMIVILLYLHVCSARSTRNRICCDATKQRKFIIDTDAGGDDALALMLSLFYEVKTCEIKILAITCTYGNAYLKDVTQNVLKTLTIANRSDVPVYIGSLKPLVNPYKFDNYFGEDGFGDFNFTQKITAKVDKTKPAAVLLVDLVKKYPGEISVVVLGPTTNIAVATMIEPNFLNYTKEVIIMGGSFRTISGCPEIEFNFKQDPESNWVIFNNTNKVLTLMPIDTVVAYNFTKKKRREIFNKLNYSISNFLNLTERVALSKAMLWEPADGMTMVIALKPEIITKSFETDLVPVIVGDTRGAVLINTNNTAHNTKVIQNFDITAFKKFIIEYLS